MGALEDISEYVERLVKAFADSAEELKILSKAIEEQWKVCKQAYIEPMTESVIDYYNQLAVIGMTATGSFETICASIYIPRDPIPKTPYKPSYKTVIFDKRLKFPKCRSNCR